MSSCCKRIRFRLCCGSRRRSLAKSLLRRRSSSATATTVTLRVYVETCSEDLLILAANYLLAVIVEEQICPKNQETDQFREINLRTGRSCSTLLFNRVASRKDLIRWCSWQNKKSLFTFWGVHSLLPSLGNSKGFKTYLSKGRRLSPSSHDGWGNINLSFTGWLGSYEWKSLSPFNIIAKLLSFRLTCFRFWSRSFLWQSVPSSVLTWDDRATISSFAFSARRASLDLFDLVSAFSFGWLSQQINYIVAPKSRRDLYQYLASN